MIRTKHNIDTKLVNFFISERIFDDEINESLITWYGSLDHRDQQITRDNAILFLGKVAYVVLNEINYPNKERKDLISTFEPLEKILRTAFSLNSTGGSNNVRDHLSHTVRNVLFCNYLLKKYYAQNNSSLRMQLFIAAIFHDIAYPIQKLKEVAHRLGDATFRDLLNSKGHVEIELNNPDDLLDMLDFFAGAKHKRELIIEGLKNDLKNDKSNESLQADIEKEQTAVNKLEHLYRNIISKAIAGKGLFDASHSISSIVLFLMPIMKFWRDSRPYQDMNLEKICDVCFTMTYHDRENSISDIKTFEVPQILRIMRISDELQEWDRESDSYIQDVTIVNDPSAVISLFIKLRDKTKGKPCKSELFIADKIIGLLPAIGQECIKVKFELPRKLNSEILNSLLEEKKVSGNYKVEDGNSKIVDLIFQNKNVNILFK